VNEHRAMPAPSLELAHVQPIVETLHRHQFVVGTLLDDLAALITRMRAESRIVLSRWAITKLVRPAINLRSPS